MRERLRRLPLRPLPWALAFGLGAACLRDRAPGDARDASAGLAAALGARGLACTPADVAWIDPPRGGSAALFGRTARALVRAHLQGEPNDLWLVRARTSPEGVVAGVASVHDVTRTTGADEGVPRISGDRAAYVVEAGGYVTSVHTLDLSRAPAIEGEPLGWLARVQDAITQWQETGQASGVGRRGWSLDPSATRVDLDVDAAGVRVRADGRAIRLSFASDEPVEGASYVVAHPAIHARPGNLVTWAVDRVRAIPWFGDERMQTVKAVAFAAADVVSRVRGSVRDDTTAEDVARDMGEPEGAHVAGYTDPETGWPPPPIPALLAPALPGEGQWVALDRDPFVATNAGAPPAFLSSFVRTDRERKYTRIYVALWDPRQVELHPMAGTVEPIGAAGETGTGLIPRSPEVMRRVVAAMNGGFQAMHGEFGMMSDGVVYLPPKPFAATVAELRDGSTGFGVWPADAEIPETIVGFRQNLTPLVLDEKANPYGRTWWGGTPPGWKDKTHTVRTGLCVTREGFVGYFYGNEIDAEVLGQAMIQARCRLGLHLDMNAGHSGLEFYRAAPANELAALGRPVQGDWEAEGAVDGMPGWRFRGRRLIRGMGLMNFPRYIHREARDFFYLTLRHVLPGADVPQPPGAEPTEGKWLTRGLPQHGFPFALATTSVRYDPSRPSARARVVAIDPRAVRVAGAAGASESAPTVLSLAGVGRAREGEPALWLGGGAFTIAKERVEGAVEIVGGLAPRAEGAERSHAAIGVVDDGSFALWVELVGPADPTGRDAAALDAWLASRGCSTRMAAPPGLEALVGGVATLGGVPAAAPGPHVATMRLVRAEAPGARALFPETPVVAAEVWQPLQAKRVRYFKKPAKAAASAGAAPEVGTPGGSAPAPEPAGGGE